MEQVLRRYVVRVYPSAANDSAKKPYFYKGVQWKWTEDIYEARIFRWHYQANRIAERWRRTVINPYWKCAIDQVLCVHPVDGELEIYGAGAERGTRTSSTP